MAAGALPGMRVEMVDDGVRSRLVALWWLW